MGVSVIEQRPRDECGPSEMEGWRWNHKGSQKKQLGRLEEKQLVGCPGNQDQRAAGNSAPRPVADALRSWEGPGLTIEIGNVVTSCQEHFIHYNIPKFLQPPLAGGPSMNKES